MNCRLSCFVLAGALSLSGFGTALAAASDKGETISFGVLPVNEPETMVERFAPLMAYLSKETGYDFELKTYC